jgi:hypothetical protein
MRIKTQAIPLSVSNSRRHPARQPGRQAAFYCANLSVKPDRVAKATEGLTERKL